MPTRAEVRKDSLRYYVKSGATAGWVSPYFDAIAKVKWLNATFGYSLTVDEYTAEDSPWQEGEERALYMHIYYEDTFNDPGVIREAKKRRVRERLERSPHFAIDMFVHDLKRYKE